MSTSADVQYAYEDGLVGTAAKYLRLKSLQYPSSVTGGLTGGIAHYNYGAANDGLVLSRLDNIADDDDGSTQYVAYDYFGTSSVFEVDHPKITTGGLVLDYDIDGDKTYAGFDRFGRIVKQQWQHNSADVDHYEYGYDYNGNRLYRKNMVNTDHSELYHVEDTTAGTEYDGLDRLKHFRRGTLAAGNRSISANDVYQTYALDSLGNWTTFDDNGTTQTRAHNAANEIGTISTWHNPTFDAAGNMASGPKPGDGSSTGGAEQEYTYDAWNRLVKVRKRQYSGGTPGDWVEVAYYRYDGLHRRIRKFAFTGTADTFDVHDYYYSRQWQVLEARATEDVSWDPDANPVVEPSVATDVTEQNLWDARYVDAPAVRWCNLNPGQDSDFSDPNEEYYFAQDANFNVTALVNGSGAVLERYEYDAYGAVRFLDASFNLKLDGGNPKTKSDYNNPYLYTGRRLDTDTGLYHYRNRDYDPYLARFTARDKSGYNAGDMNLYAYVGGGPVDRVDPQGLMREFVKVATSASR